jgi:hypothetical protein
MGNLCSSERDPFSQPGRPLGTTPAAPTSASVPASAKAPRKVGGPPRTLGGGGEAGPSSTSSASGPAGDARAKAAAAAEVCHVLFSSTPIPSHLISSHTHVYTTPHIPSLSPSPPPTHLPNPALPIHPSNLHIPYHGAGADDILPTPQARLQQSKKGAGKLQTALDQRRGMTDAEALKHASETERRQRDLDQSASALNYS